MLPSEKFCHGLRVRLVLSQCPTIPMLTSGINFELSSLVLLGNFSTPINGFFYFLFCFVPVLLMLMLFMSVLFFDFNFLLLLLYRFLFCLFLWFFLFLFFLRLWLKSNKLVERFFTSFHNLYVDLNNILRNCISSYRLSLPLSLYFWMESWRGG